MASSTVWLAIVGLLAAFVFEKAKDENGHEIDIKPLFEGNIVR